MSSADALVHCGTEQTMAAAPLQSVARPAFPTAGDAHQHRPRRRRRDQMAATSCPAPSAGRRRRALRCISAAAALSFLPDTATGHGYLQSPRARNLVAYQDKNYEFPAAGDPKPEDCPHCLNRGGTLAQCGVLFGEGLGTFWERNYDAPLTLHDQPMPPNLQGVYQEGSVIEVEVLVTTHHKGHFEFALCPIDSTQSPLPVPTEECFQQHKLEFVSDELYGAPKDPNYPHRAYLAPASVAHSLEPAPGVRPVVGEYYKLTFQLPDGVAGDLILLQWYYLTANSCKHEGYAEYSFPEEWGEDVRLYPGLPDCGEVPPDGDGVPEQFWNCAEIMIVGPSKDSTAPLGSPVAPNARLDSMASMGAAVDAPSPPSQSPTPWRPCQKSASTYYEATDDCSGYYVCANHEQGQLHECPGGTQLYDEAKQMCNWADEVTCTAGPPAPPEPRFDANGNLLPTQRPTPTPTPPPNVLHEWDPNAHPRGHDKTIIGYYASWQWYDRNGLAAPTAFDFTKMTRVNFAFFQITEEGYIYGTDEWADPITLFGFYDWMADEGTARTYCSWDAPNAPPNCMAHKYEEGLIYRAHQAGAEVYPSIGGWSLSDPFPAMAANPEARANFARQCVELIRNYNFDGIDLDWEYPGYEPHSGGPADTVNFNRLLDDVRAALDELGAETGKYYGLTAALPCGPPIIDNQDIAKVGAVLTELNLMTYDLHGSWNDKTGVNSPLYDQEDSPELSVHGCVNNWLEGGAPREKINIGWAFYGRSFLGAQGLHESHEGNDESTWWADEGVPQYYNIMDKMDEMENYRDEQTRTQVAYGETGMVSYDDPRAICDKTEYAQIHGFNGYIIWELSGDLMPDLSTPLLDAGNAKLLDPNLDCASLDLSTQVNALISEAHPGAASASGGATTSVIFYADYAGGVCLSDGLHPEWMSGNDLFTSLEDCCSAAFNWNANCVDDSPATADPAPMAADVAAEEAIVAKATTEEKPLPLLWYPFQSGSKCVRDGKQPGWMTADAMFETHEACCNHHYQWSNDCISTDMAMGPSRPQADETRPFVGAAPTKTPTRYPTPHPTRQTKRPTRHPTPRPSRVPTAYPTRKPTPPSYAAQMEVDRWDPAVIQPDPTRRPTPRPTRQTKRPTKYPTLRPSRFPTPDPTRRPTPPSYAGYSMIQTEADSWQAQPDPTRRPTRRPATRRPTPNSAASSFAATFSWGSPAAAYTTIPREEPSVVQYAPSKGQEQPSLLGQSISNQMQQTLAPRPKKAKTKAGSNYVKGAKKKAKQMVSRQKKLAKKKAARVEKKQKAAQTNARRQQKKRQRAP